MFQACAVKMAKMAAHSTPSSLPGNSPMKKVTVKVRNPSTGTDCRMSSAGTITSSAFLLLAARVATTKVNSSEQARAANIRSVVSTAYLGRFAGSRLIGATFRPASGWPMVRAAWVTSTAAPAISSKAIRSARLGANLRRA